MKRRRVGGGKLQKSVERRKKSIDLWIHSNITKSGNESEILQDEEKLLIGDENNLKSCNAEINLKSNVEGLKKSDSGIVDDHNLGTQSRGESSKDCSPSKNDEQRAENKKIGQNEKKMRKIMKIMKNHEKHEKTVKIKKNQEK